MNMYPNATTDIYGIVGHPVGHSLSPVMHNSAFRILKINAVYLAFDVTNLEAAINGIKALGIKGVSVTIPHKQAVIEFLDEIDDMAKRIGAVNTIINRDGILFGTNTDWLGGVRALEEVIELKDKKVVIIGAGGSARAICIGLKDRGAIIHIANRTVSKAKELALLCGGSFSGLKELDEISSEFDILINTTPVGMYPKHNEIVIDPKLLSNFNVVMDIVYSPVETLLLKEARKRGCKTITGLKMLLYQAIAQFELWINQLAPIKEMEKALLKAIG